jgi:hypothetical protein
VARDLQRETEKEKKDRENRNRGKNGAAARKEAQWAGEPVRQRPGWAESNGGATGGPKKGWRLQPGAQRTLMPTWYSRTFFRARTCMWLDT